MTPPELKVCLLQSAIDRCLAPCVGEKCGLMGNLFDMCGIAVEARWKSEDPCDGEFDSILHRGEVAPNAQ